MNFEPQKFFIGLIDFFSVWLPGALLVYLLKDQIGQLVVGQALPLAGTEAWAVFLFASYLTGHLVFLGGSFLDDSYDRLRQGTRDGQVNRLASGKKLSFRLTRGLAKAFGLEKDDKALRQALRLKQEQLDPVGASSAVNAFQWCKAKLALEHREALAEVERFEADSKFFRSLCAILILLLAWEVVKAGAAALWPDGPFDAIAPSLSSRYAGLFAAGLLVFAAAFWRYAERRAKATSQAYWFALATSCAVPTKRRRALAASGTPTHAGGLVLRKVGEDPEEYLRVTAKRKAKPWEFPKYPNEQTQWVLPKGHIEPGEEPERTAVREVLEEAGIWARVRDELTEIEFGEEGERVRVRFFVMEFLKTDSPVLAKPHPWLFLSEGKDGPREIAWKGLRDYGDLPSESQMVVEASRPYLIHLKTRFYN